MLFSFPENQNPSRFGLCLLDSRPLDQKTVELCFFGSKVFPLQNVRRLAVEKSLKFENEECIWRKTSSGESDMDTPDRYLEAIGKKTSFGCGKANSDAV